MHTVAEQASVSIHDKVGHPRTAFLPGHCELGGRRYDAIEHTMARDRWPEVEAAYLPRARRAHRLGDRRA